MPPELLKKLPPRSKVGHLIKLELVAKLPTIGHYCIAPPELKELKRRFKEFFDVGFIQPLKKHGRSLQICIDYQKLNKLIVKNKYPFFLVANLFNRFGREWLFTKMDLRLGYWQVGWNGRNGLVYWANMFYNGWPPTLDAILSHKNDWNAGLILLGWIATRLKFAGMD
ncbi:hypothetical protein Nepgr_017965 [Nepenthes gracilis]|uniref:Uncharacterized protein n=1 Tax=Nepenthes gracilis TaxID=150966 RepID=A0AAD3XTL9_NEPGR|nr:hypothetical protein Nepgr_017965 [Nepenthes gracilis]